MHLNWKVLGARIFGSRYEWHQLCRCSFLGHHAILSYFLCYSPWESIASAATPFSDRGTLLTPRTCPWCGGHEAFCEGYLWDPPRNAPYTCTPSLPLRTRETVPLRISNPAIARRRGAPAVPVRFTIQLSTARDFVFVGFQLLKFIQIPALHKPS